MRAFLGIDLGLSGARAAVVDGEGRLISTGRRRVEVSPESGELDIGLWLEAGAEAVRLALAGSGGARIDALGVGAFGPCAVPLGANGRPNGPASVFAHDTRHEPWRRRLSAERGSAVDADHVLPKILRLREREPERFAATSMVADVTGCVVGELTGRPVIDPITALDHTLDGVEPPCPLPPVRPADSVAGHVTASAAREWGLPAGAPVAVGSYDSYVDLFGAGVRDRGQAGILLGSTMVVSAVADVNAAPPELRLGPHIGPGLAMGGWTSAAGSLIAWAERVAAAGNVPPGGCLPGSAGLLMLPYFAGERAPVWDPDARGALLGLTLASTGADLRQAAIEAVALSAADICRHLDAALGKVERFRLAGGGAGVPGLAQAVADAVDASIEVVDHPGEALGGALLAARAAGRDVQRPVRGVLEPDRRASARYAELLDLYRPLYRQLAHTMHRLGQIAARREDQ